MIKKLAKIKKSNVKKKKRRIPKGVVHILTTFNNIIITISNLKGDVVCWSSAGACGFKGKRKATSFAAKEVASTAAKISLEKGFQQVMVVVKGPGYSRHAALRGLKQTGLRIILLRDITGIPHNGCRPPKKKRR